MRGRYLGLSAAGWVTALGLLLMLAASVRVGRADVPPPTATPPGPIPSAVPAGANGEIIHAVGRGETLQEIADRYGVDFWRLAAWPAPAVVSASCPCEQIVILSPTQRVTITNPVTVTGYTASYAGSVVVAVLDGSAQEIGHTYDADRTQVGAGGVFTATVPFTAPADSQPGRIQVWQMSPSDGAMAHLNSVPVVIRGLGLDPLLFELDSAITARDDAELRSLMGDAFRIVPYLAPDAAAPSTRSLQPLSFANLDLAGVHLDFSVDARKLLRGRVELGPEVVHVVYSTGWGADHADDAFLLIGDMDGQARWIGMIYVPQADIDYR